MSSAKVALIVSYNGASFHGFQYQSPSVPTVQDRLQFALGRVADHEVTVVCAGRTDAGVHATHQVVHFDTTAERKTKAWVFGTNTYLPDTVCVTWAGSVGTEFDARFSATARRYVYLIYNSPIRSALLGNELTRERRELDESRMADGGRALVGEHDFSSYRAAECQSPTPVRKIERLDVYRRGQLVVIDITANGFLHHMVRNIAGVLIDIGACDAPSSWAGEVLAMRDRRRAGVTAPPNGLYLVDVSYPSQFGVPAGPDFPHLYSLLSN